MKDLGESPSTISSPQKEKYYPSITLTTDDLGKGIEVGENITIKAVCKVVSIDISMGEKKRYRLELRKFEKVNDEKE